MKRIVEDTRVKGVLLLLAVIAFTPSAHAGIVDTPLPVLVAGQRTFPSVPMRVRHFPYGEIV